jgi:thiamine biosynthesis lipoprotein ApbE
MLSPILDCIADLDPADTETLSREIASSLLKLGGEIKSHGPTGQQWSVCVDDLPSFIGRALKDVLEKL